MEGSYGLNMARLGSFEINKRSLYETDDAGGGGDDGGGAVVGL